MRLDRAGVFPARSASGRRSLLTKLELVPGETCCPRGRYTFAPQAIVWAVDADAIPPRFERKHAACGDPR